MKSFKQIIFENPEDVYPDGTHASHMDFSQASYTLLVYKDNKSKKVEWIAYQYAPEKILTSNESIGNDMRSDKPEDVAFMRWRLEDLRSMPSHYHLREILNYFGYNAVENPNERSLLDGRVYEYRGKWYISFWQSDVNEILGDNKLVFDDFLKAVNISYYNVFFENEFDGRKFDPYVEVFKQQSQPKTTELQRRMKQMSWDLHVKKGQLDKAIVQALQTKPKDVNTLYQRLEKEFGMPVAKIKHLYGAVPLDKLISKKAKELVNESIHPADRWVGVVDHNGSVILPPNQDGDRQHYHYGLEGHLYRFSYWPHKKEVSWWNFPSDEEELAVKVEDYLIRKGYPVDRHVDYTGRKIRDTLNESMFPKDFDRHSLGSCMAAAAMATDYLLSKGRSDFKVVEGWVSLDPNQEEEDFSPHTWIQFNNGKIFDPTKKQWAVWGFDPNEVRFESIKKTYTPEEYQSVCQRQPDDVSKFKKMAEATMINDNIPDKVYHATYRALLDEILDGGIVPGGKDIQNFDWSGKYVYLAETPENAISFVENAENESIPEEWLDDIVVLEVDVSKLDLTNMAPDENWNPSIEDGEEGYRSFQYNGIVPPEAIRVL